jgi:hypothetical protein
VNVTTEVLVTSGTFVSCCLFAAALHLAVKRFGPVLDDWTWFVVSIGTGIVLLWLQVEFPQEQWMKVVRLFFVGSIPVIGRSVLSTWDKHRRRLD